MCGLPVRVIVPEVQPARGFCRCFIIRKECRLTLLVVSLAVQSIELTPRGSDHQMFVSKVQGRRSKQHAPLLYLHVAITLLPQRETLTSLFFWFPPTMHITKFCFLNKTLQ